MAAALKTGAPTCHLDLTWHPKQREVFTSTASVIVHAKGRRFGGTEGGMRWQLGKCLTRPEHRALWVDLTHRNTKRYWKRYALRALRPLAQAAEARDEGLDRYVKMDWAEGTARFWNGSYLDFASCERPENAEGQAYDTIFLNEAGHALWDPLLWDETLSPMLIENPKAQIMASGAPKGVNKMDTLAKLAAGNDAHGHGTGEPGHAFFHHTSFDNPFLDPATIKRFTRGMTPAMYDQEILAKFVDDGTRYFQNSDDIFSGEPAPPVPGHQYVAGGDPAKVDDWFSVWVIDVTVKRAVHKERWQRIPWRESAARVANILKRFNGAGLYLDATGVGDAIVEMIAAHEVSVVPIVFTPASKVELMSGLAAAIQNKSFTACEDENTQAELRAFRAIRQPSGNLKLEAPPGLHDDDVCALALANHGFQLTQGVVVVTGKSQYQRHEDGELDEEGQDAA